MSRIPYVDLAAHNAPLRGRILQAVGRVLDHGQFILGPEVAALERQLARRIGVDHVVTCGSGTAALQLALRLRGIGAGDEVITASHSFVATASAIRLAQASPVLVDIDERTMTLDPQRAADAVTPRTRAIMPVHLNGYPCDLGPFTTLCARHDICLIEDCAQAFGAVRDGRHVGSSGLGCFSLHPLKPLSACGDGGFLAVRDRDDAERLRRLRNLGLRDRDHCDEVSSNSRLDTLQAAILLVKLEEVDRWLAARRDHAAAYRRALRGSVILPPDDEETVCSYSAFVIRHGRRDAIERHLRRLELDVKIHYPLAIHQQPAFAHLAHGPLPVTERVVDQILSLPVSAELGETDRQRVIAGVQTAVAAAEGTET